MRHIKNYSEAEIDDLVIGHNRLVKDCYKTDRKGMYWLISEADDSQDLVSPYFELGSNETLSGAAHIFDLEWEDE